MRDRETKAQLRKRIAELEKQRDTLLRALEVKTSPIAPAPIQFVPYYVPEPRPWRWREYEITWGQSGNALTTGSLLANTVQATSASEYMPPQPEPHTVSIGDAGEFNVWLQNSFTIGGVS